MGEEKSSGAETTSLVKAIHILDYLAKCGGYVSVNSMSKDLNISKPTLVRQLSTFKAYGFVTQDPETKQYALGLALISIGDAARQIFDLPRNIHPCLEKLAHETGESVSLMVLRNGRAVNIDHILSPRSLIGGIQGIGTELILHISASGKLLLSSLPDQEIDAYIDSGPLLKKTKNTITTPEALWRELRDIRKKGYSLDDEEYEIGCRSLSAPIHNQSGNIIAAVSISAPSVRLNDEALPHLISVVTNIAEEASIRISH